MSAENKDTHVLNSLYYTLHVLMCITVKATLVYVILIKNQKFKLHLF